MNTQTIASPEELRYEIENGRTLNNIKILSGNSLTLQTGDVLNTAFVSGGELIVGSGAVAYDVINAPRGSTSVLSGGELRNLHVSGGYAEVLQGGKVYGAVIADYDVLLLGYLSGAVISAGGHMKLDSKNDNPLALAENIVLNGGSVNNWYCDLRNVVVNSDGFAHARYGGSISGLRINSGGSGETIQFGKASDVIVNNGGEFTLCQYCPVSNVTIRYGGSAGFGMQNDISGLIAIGGTLTGPKETPSNAEGATFRFDVCDRRPGDGAMMINYNQLIGGTYELQVNQAQNPGTYTLIYDGFNFDEAITVKDTSGETLGTLTWSSPAVASAKSNFNLRLSDTGSVELLVTKKVINQPHPITIGEKEDHYAPTLSTTMDTWTFSDEYNVFAWDYAKDDVGVDRYEIRYSANADMSDAQTVSVSAVPTTGFGSYAGNICVAVLPSWGEGTWYWELSALDAKNNRSMVLTGGNFVTSHIDDAQIGRTFDDGLFYLSGYARDSLISDGRVINDYVTPMHMMDTVISGPDSYQHLGNRWSVAVSTVVSSGGEQYVGGGTAIDTTVLSGGRQFLDGGATVINTHVESGGMLRIDSGNTLRGEILLGGTLSCYVYDDRVIDASEAVIVYDISDRSFEDDAIITALKRLQGGEYRLNVDARQAVGCYKLAGYAENFDGTITVQCGSTIYGEVGVGETLSVDNRSYSLAKNSNTLTLTIEGDAPVAEVTHGDLNGDNRADIIMTITQTTHPYCGATGAWMITDTQTAAWGNLSQRETGWSIFGTGVTTAGKATDDIYIKSADNVVGAWTTNASGEVDGWQTIGQFDANTQVLGLGDFNGDWQTDLLLRNTNGAVGCYLTDGTGWNYFQSLGDEWTIAATGDFNGDGRSDIVLKHDAGFAGTWLTLADGTVEWHNLDTLPNGFEIVGAGDFNGDGADDVLLKKGTYYGAWIVKGGSVDSWMGLGDLGNVTVEQIGDFNGDGKDDLRIRTAAGDLGAQLVNGADSLTWKYYGSVGQEWSTSLAAI